MNDLIADKPIAFQKSDKKFAVSGERLNHFLDLIGFMMGHGRNKKFQQYLARKRPDNFRDLKYGTVRSWFAQSSPSSDTITLILEALSDDYVLHATPEEISFWWKTGQNYPFNEAGKQLLPGRKSNVNTYDNERIIGQSYIRMYQVAESLGIDLFNDIDPQSLLKARQKVTQILEGTTIKSSDELKVIIESTLNLAKNNLL